MKIGITEGAGKIKLRKAKVTTEGTNKSIDIENLV